MMLRLASATVNVLMGDGGVTQILYKDMVDHEKSAIDGDFINARDNGVSMADALAMEDQAHRRLDALKASVKEDPNVVLAKDHKTGHFVVAEGIFF